MAEKQSTSLCNMLLDGYSLKTAVAVGMKLFIYAGTPPATADAALASNNLLATVDNAGAAVTMAATPSGGVAVKTVSETWTANGNVTGAGTQTATFYRLQKTADAGGADAGGTGILTPRIQGTIGMTGTEDMVVSNSSLVNGAAFSVTTFTQAMVPS